MIEIVYEDSDIVVCRKAAGILSQGAEGSRGGPCLTDLLAEEYTARGERAEILPVHRLDRPTAGLIVYARRAEAAAALTRAMAEGRFEKEYLAVVEGVPPTPGAELCDLLYFDRQRDKSFVVKRPRRGVKEARLTYTLLATRTPSPAEGGGAAISARDGAILSENPTPCVAKSQTGGADRPQKQPAALSLLRVRLGTGRTHQIRVQLASRRLPLAGDARYGAASRGQLALFSTRLAFPHPRTGKLLELCLSPADEPGFSLFRDLV